MTPRAPRAAERAALAAAALGARAFFLAAASRATGVPWRDLALRFDGHVYLAVAKTWPRLYQGVPSFLPMFRGSEYFTGWFPLYPVLIRAAAVLVGDARAAALAVSFAASAAAVLLFRRLAGSFTTRPGLAASLFCFFPATWLVTGSLAFVEPVFLCALLAAALAALEDRPGACAAAAAAAMLAQKTGFLVLPIALALVAARRGRRGLRAFAPLGLALLAPTALQLYLWRTFGDPLVNFHVQRDIFGGAMFGWPFAAFVSGALTPSPLGGGAARALIASSGAFYLFVAAAAWRRARADERPLLAWLLIVLVPHFCLAGHWAFFSLPRLLLMGAPPALLLSLPLLPRGERWLLFAAPLVLLPFFAGLLDVARAEVIVQGAWPPGYFAFASEALR